MIDQEDEDAIEAAYWQFDHDRKKIDGMSERDAFKGQARRLLRRWYVRHGIAVTETADGRGR